MAAKIDNFDVLLQDMEKHFDQIPKETSLFEVSHDKDLFEIFLANIPDHRRQYYTCHCCKQFINKYGNIVYLDKNWNVRSAIWPSVVAEEELISAISTIKKIVESSSISSVFLSEDKKWGVPENLDPIRNHTWTHFHLINDRIFKSKNLNADQTMAEKRQDLILLRTSLEKYDLTHFIGAKSLKDVMSGSEKIIGAIDWCIDLIQKMDGNKNKKNILWAAAASAPPGFCHFANTVVGTVLDDIKAGHDFQTIRNKFAAKTRPEIYQRPQSPPTQGNIARAEELVKKLGIDKSLPRRFARIEDLVTIWKPSEMKELSRKEGGVFSHLLPGAKNIQGQISGQPPIKITWEKFARDVMFNAYKLEYFVRPKDLFGTLITAVNPDAPPIIQWDSETLRNPTTWYTYSNPTSASQWNLKEGYNIITAICYGPYMWHQEYASKFTHQAKRTFLLLENCKDTKHANSGGSFFPSQIKNELREIRSTIEAYAQTAQIANFDEGNASGIILAQNTNSSASWNVKVRVTDKNNTCTEYLLDRWD